MVHQTHKEVREDLRSFLLETRVHGVVSDGSEGDGNVEAEVNVVVGCLCDDSDEFRCQLWVCAASNVGLPGPGGWLEGGEEFLTLSTILIKALLECDGSVLPVGIVAAHVLVWDTTVRSVARPMEALDESVPPSIWSGFCTCYGQSNECADVDFANVRPLNLFGGFGWFGGVGHGLPLGQLCRPDEELTGCAEASALGFLDCCCWSAGSLLVFCGSR